MSSCFLLTVEDDNIDGIYNTVHECAKLSKYAGGSWCRCPGRERGSRVRGTNVISTGIVPMLRNFNATARYVN